MGSDDHLDFKRPHSEKDILSRFVFDLCRCLKQLDSSRSYTAVCGAESIPQHMDLLDEAGHFLGQRSCCQTNTAINWGREKTRGSFCFSRTFSKESDSVPVRNGDIFKS